MAEEFSLRQENSILEREREGSLVPLDLESTLLHTLTVATESSAGHPGGEELERRVLKKKAMWTHFSISTPQSLREGSVGKDLPHEHRNSAQLSSPAACKEGQCEPLILVLGRQQEDAWGLLTSQPV